MLGRSVDKIRTTKEQEAALNACNALNLDGLVILGGTFSNTDAAHLAEYLSANGCSTKVISVPVTIDGDVHNQFVEATLGFDTATRVYSQLVGNMATDGNSAKKYWYFVKLMGRAVSRITLEVALQVSAALGMHRGIRCVASIDTCFQFRSVGALHHHQQHRFSALQLISPF